MIRIKQIILTIFWTVCCSPLFAQHTLWQKLTGDTTTKEKLKESSIEDQILPIDAITNIVTYTDVIEAPGLTQKKLYENAKKWIATKNSTINPYTVTFEDQKEGSITAKGTFSLPEDRRKYVVQFVIKIATKDNKFKYEFTDLIIQFHTQAGSSSGGYGGFGGSSYREAETLEYSLETFYPARLHGRKPAIKWYEEIRKDSFETINREMQSIVNSLKQAIVSKDDW